MTEVKSRENPRLGADIQLSKQEAKLGQDPGRAGQGPHQLKKKCLLALNK